MWGSGNFGFIEKGKGLGVIKIAASSCHLQKEHQAGDVEPLWM